MRASLVRSATLQSLGGEVAGPRLLVTFWPCAPSRMPASTLAAPQLQSLKAKWPDQTTRGLLVRRAVQDAGQAPRGAARAVVGGEVARTRPPATCWSTALSRMAASPPRRAALQSLAEKWPDQTTRDLVVRLAVQDNNEATRHAALRSLAAKWPEARNPGSGQSHVA